MKSNAFTCDFCFSGDCSVFSPPLECGEKVSALRFVGVIRRTAIEHDNATSPVIVFTGERGNRLHTGDTSFL